MRDPVREEEPGVRVHEKCSIPFGQRREGGRAICTVDISQAV
jgi:hypothetical protein